MVGHVWPASANEKVPEDGSPLLGYAAGLTTWFLIGGVLVAAKFGISELPPWTFVCWRVAIAALFLLPLTWGARHEMVAFLRKRWLEALFTGAIGFGITQGLIYSALVYTSAVNAGIIMSTTPIFTLILAGIVLKEPVGKWQYLGSAIALTGIVITAVQGSLAVLLGLRFGIGDLLMLIAACTFAVYTILLKRAEFELAKLPLMVVLLTGAVIGTLPGFLLELWNGEHENLAWRGWLALAYVAIPGGALAYYLYNWSVGILGAARAGALLYSQMIFAAILAWLILGETIHWYQFLGAGLIIVGVLFVELFKADAPKAAAAGT